MAGVSADQGLEGLWRGAVGGDGRNGAGITRRMFAHGEERLAGATSSVTAGEASGQANGAHQNDGLQSRSFWEGMRMRKGWRWCVGCGCGWGCVVAVVLESAGKELVKECSWLGYGEVKSAGAK